MSAWRHWEPPSGSIPTLEVPSLAGAAAVHLIGIGGAGMRNLARLLDARGIAVTGSDIKDSAALHELQAAGIGVHVGHDPAHVGHPDVVVISSAIAEGNVELRAARDAGMPVWKRQQALAALAAGRRTIAVTGTHGKTTTTSMVSTVLLNGGADPTFLIGGDLNESGSGARHGEGLHVVFEADESDGSFLLTRPWAGIVTSVGVDHVDFYTGGLDDIVAAFAEFMSRCDHVIACGDDGGVSRSIEVAGVAPTTYGIGNGNDVVVSVDRLGPEGARGHLRLEDGSELTLELKVDGAHNLLDATAAVVAGRLAGIDPEVSASALSAFAGVHRRFEHRGSARGADFYDDYGHVPAEMEVTIATARRRVPERLIAVVQPHRYARVQALWRELGASVTGADLVIVTDVYGAAQQPIPGVTGRLVADGVVLAAPGLRTVYLPHRQDVVDFLDREVREGDLVVTMGCGDVWMLGDAALARIREREEAAGG